VLKLCIVYEAEADCQIGCDLADRVVVDCIDWLSEQPALLQFQREWIIQHQGILFRWDRIDDLGRGMNIRIRGYEDGEEKFPDFKAAVRAVRVIQNLFDDVDAIVLIRDVDDEPERVDGLNQAKNRFDEGNRRFRVIVGAARTKRECWVLAGFHPVDDLENRLFDEEREYLGFDPTTSSHKLTAKNNEKEDKKSAKRVLRQLTRGDSLREEECWTQTPLELLKSKGKANGLAEYLVQVEEVLVPMIVRR